MPNIVVQVSTFKDAKFRYKKAELMLGFCIKNLV